MYRRIFFLLIILALLFSCGTPEIFNFTDAIYISGTTTQTTPRLLVRLDSDELSELGLSEVDLNKESPSLLLLYSMSNNTNTQSFASRFSSSYRGSSFSGYPVTNLEDGICSYETFLESSNSNTQYTTALYPLIRNDKSNISDPAYTFSRTTDSINLVSNSNYTFEFYLKENEVDGGFYLECNILYPDGVKKEYTFTRIDNKAFYPYSSNNSDTNEDYSINRNRQASSQNTYIHIYAAMNIRGNFSNIYWSDLKKVGCIEIK